MRKRSASACSFAATSRARLACSLAWMASDPPCSAMPSCTRATSSSTWATASAASATCSRRVRLCACACSARASRSGLLASGSAIVTPKYPSTRDGKTPKHGYVVPPHPSDLPCRNQPWPSGAGPCSVRSSVEPPRDSWRLRLVRGWSHDTTRQVSSGAAGASRATGVGAPGRAPFAVGGDLLHRPQVRCLVRDAGQVGPAGRDRCGLAAGADREERERRKGLEREVRELRRANEILKVASAFFAAERGRRPTR
jgi:hypothetical protein